MQPVSSLMPAASSISSMQKDTTAALNSLFQGAPTAGPVLPPTNPDAEPADIPKMLAQLPKMNATVGPVNNGNVTITLINIETETLYIDPDFSFLSPGVESLVMNLTDAQGATLPVGDNYEAVDADFVSLTSLDNMTAVGAGQNVSRAVNLTEIFVAPGAGVYTLSIQPFIMGGNESIQSNFSDIDNYVIKIESQPTAVTLDASSSTVNPATGKSVNTQPGPQMSNEEFTARVKDLTRTTSRTKTATEQTNAYANILNCDTQDTQDIIKSTQAAIIMATNAARDTKYDWLRKLYFGSNWHSGMVWWNILSSISTYNITDASNPTGLTFICDRASEKGLCPQSGVLAYTYRYNDGQRTPDYIVLCDMYFGLSDYNYWFPGYTWFAEQPYDKPTLVVHELTHSESVVGEHATTDVPDKTWYSWFQGLGLWSGGCYRHSCAVRLAAGKGWDGFGPLDNAQNFVWYSKYIR